MGEYCTTIPLGDALEQRERGKTAAIGVARLSSVHIFAKTTNCGFDVYQVCQKTITYNARAQAYRNASTITSFRLIPVS